MFAVIYKFKIKKGLEAQFEKSWADMTHEFRELHGGLGSCLHKDDDGEYLAYARWPNREMWEMKKQIKNTKAMDLMKSSIEKSYSAIPLKILDNLLVNR